MESSSLWTPIYRKVSNFGNFVSIYIYIYISNSPVKKLQLPRSHIADGFLINPRYGWVRYSSSKRTFPYWKKGRGREKEEEDRQIGSGVDTNYDISKWKCINAAVIHPHQPHPHSYEYTYLSLSPSTKNKKKANHREGREREREFRVADRIYRIYGI